ncbi:MAG: hypothetical protein HY867_01625 [Chloroflexi bacterium]|nr:hypothetical protein [Chloroflexota bacterium]
MKKPILPFLLAFVFLMILLSGCAPAPQTLGVGPLPDNVAKALDAAIQNQYCTPNSFTAKSLRMMSQMKGISSGYVEMETTGPNLPFAVLEGGAPTLNPVSPSYLKIRGQADGTDISILNYEEFIIQVEADTDLGGVIVPKGSTLARDGGSWVLVDNP